MNGGERRTQEARYLLPLIVGIGILVAAVPGRGDAADTCLVSVHDESDHPISSGCKNGTSCTFMLKACVNDAESGCTAGQSKKKKIHAKGQHCGGIGKLQVGASSSQSCGTPASILVKTKKHGKKPGVCKITIAVKTKDGRSDKDQLTLTCNPSSGPQCPATTSTTTTTVATRTTTTAPFCAPPVVGGTSPCTPIVVGQPIPGTYKLQGMTGEMRCTTNAAANRFGACATIADCGNTAGSCLALPWVTADGQIMPFPTGTQTTFTVNAAGAAPACAHDLCIPCGNPNAPCAGIPACEQPGNPSGCVPRGTQGCCDRPGFIVPIFFVDILGGLCSRVDQYDCGVGIINTSNPQTGDLEVTKHGDTSDPGPDCTYGTGDDVAKPCNASAAGAGGDYAGKIVTSYGNGSPDPNGIQYRLQTPELSTTWMDAQSPPGTCAPNSVFDKDDAGLVSQILLKAEPTTAGATGAFTDQNGDSCSRVGSGFTALAPDGPITVPGGVSGPARPQPYDGSAGSVAAAVSEVFSGLGSPIHDIGFVAITPNMPIVTVPPMACCCTPAAGCPE